MRLILFIVPKEPDVSDEDQESNEDCNDADNCDIVLTAGSSDIEFSDNESMEEVRFIL